MGMDSMRKLRRHRAQRAKCSLPVEMVCAAQAIDLRAELAAPSPAVAAARFASRAGAAMLGRP